MRLRFIVLATLATAIALNANTEVCESPLCRLVSAGSLPELRWPDFSDYRSRVHSFYRTDAYALVWTDHGRVTKQAKSVMQALRSASAKGLEPEDYDASRWPARVAALEEGRSESEFARFDLALTVSAMRYLSDLSSGRFNTGLYSTGFRSDSGDDLARFLRKRLIAGDDINSAIESLEPRYPAYWRTQRALELYSRFAMMNGTTTLPIPKKTVEPGSAYVGNRELAAVLRRLGDLQAGAPASETYAEPLVTAVKHFQARHGLEPDGRLGAKTLEQLNIPLSHRVLQLRLALERWRWMPRLSDSFVAVNIPEFRLQVLNQEHEPELDMKVITGKAGRNATRLFVAEMKSVIFRPYWEVPPRILREEILPRISKDGSYLVAHDYEIVGPKGVLPTVTLNSNLLDALRKGTLRVRQVPGPENALGFAKFLFPNPHDVYMHDTPTKTLFTRSRRDFSHGCIRVEKPAELAAWVLRDKPGWTPQRIANAMNGSDTVPVPMERPIPVITVYWTATVSKSGEAHFFPDVYGQDAKLEKRLTSAAPGQRPRE